MGAIDLVQTLMDEGVEFATDGSRVRWRNSGGRMTPETVAELAAVKTEIIEFLTRSELAVCQAYRLHLDAGAYLEFLLSHGPATYGAAASDLDWPATRAWQAEARLRATGLVRLGDLGKAHPVATLGGNAIEDR